MTLVIIFGPPVVGKMTVGLELERLTGFCLFHNHMTVDPVVRLFPFESPAYRRLVTEFRRRVFEEYVATDSLRPTPCVPGLIAIAFRCDRRRYVPGSRARAVRRIGIPSRMAGMRMAEGSKGCENRAAHGSLQPLRLVRARAANGRRSRRTER